MTTAMLSAKNSYRIGYSQLAMIEPPRATNSWRPVKHVDLVNELIDALQVRGMQPTRAEYAVSKDNLKLFGTFIFEDYLGGEYTTALGFRASNDKRMSIQAVAGAHVFVCDNMMLSGQHITFKRKHTSGLNLRQVVRDGIERYLKDSDLTTQRIERIRAISLSDDEAKSALYDLLQTKILPSKLLPTVHEAYFDKLEEYPDCAPRSLWGLHNACTRGAKLLEPARQFEFTRSLGEVFHL